MVFRTLKEAGATYFGRFWPALFCLAVLTSSSLSAEAQTFTMRENLSFNTANYTQCDTLLVQVQVATDVNFTQIVDQSNWLWCQPNSTFIYSANLPLLQGYFYWRGRHQNQCTSEVSAWSAPYRFYLFFDASKLTVGDVNGDGFINLMDLVYLVEYLFQGGLPPGPIQAGDVNCDGKCAIGDLLYLVNYMFKFGPAPCNP